MKLELKKVYFLLLFILLFNSYNISLYGYFIPNYIVLGLGIIMLIFIFIMEMVKIKIKKINILYTLVFFIICFLFCYRNQQLYSNFTSNIGFLIALGVIFTLQFSKKWVNMPYKIINIFTFEHLIGTYFVYFFPNIYSKYILPIFSDSGGYQDLLNQVRHNMIAGFTGNYGVNAIYLTIGFLIFFTRVITNNKKNNKWNKILLAIIYFAIILTGKRGPLIFGTLTAIIIYMFVNRKNIPNKIFKILFGVTALSILLLIAAPYFPSISLIYDRIFNSTNVLNGREKLYSLAFSLFQKSPFLGIGFGNFKYYYSAFYNVAELLNVHNTYLQFLCELGIVGTVLMLFFMFHTLKKTYKMYKNMEYSNYHQELAISFGIQVFVILIGITSTPIHGVEALFPYIISSVIPYAISINCKKEG